MSEQDDYADRDLRRISPVWADFLKTIAICAVIVSVPVTLFVLNILAKIK
jgi:uncharacterized protein (DUF2062 family)